MDGILYLSHLFVYFFIFGEAKSLIYLKIRYQMVSFTMPCRHRNLKGTNQAQGGELRDLTGTFNRRTSRVWLEQC